MLLHCMKCFREFLTRVIEVSTVIPIIQNEILRDFKLWHAVSFTQEK